jgi:hypothetical protein
MDKFTALSNSKQSDFYDKQTEKPAHSPEAFAPG